MATFKTVDEVELVLGYTFTPNQYIMILNFIKYGVRPDPDGCQNCEPAYIRKIIGEMEQYNGPWPWPDPPQEGDALLVDVIDAAAHRND